MTTTVNKDVLSVVKKLQSSSCTVVFQGLYDIRNNFLKTPALIKEYQQNNGLKYLLKFIRKPNEKIVDISLSILATLCVQENIRDEVGESDGIIPHLLNLIVNIKRDSIVGRACRLIGNLAMSDTLALKLHQKGSVSKLIDTIKSTDSSCTTKQMCVRALRHLWNVESFRKSMVQDQAVRVVASLLSTKEDELLRAVLKALALFTYRCDENCALEVQGDGHGYEDIISNMKERSKRQLAVSVALNLCYIPQVHPLLGTAGIVDAIVQLLSDGIPENFSSDEVSILCLICRESVNRGHIRCGGGLKILLDALRCKRLTHLEDRALHAVLYFFYDETSLEIMIRDGLVDVLVEKLNKIIKRHESSHTFKKSKVDTPNSSTGISGTNKRKRTRSPTSNSSSRKLSPNTSKRTGLENDPLGLRKFSSFRENNQSGHWSPGSCQSMELSPDTLRTCSPPLPRIGWSPSPSSLSPLSHSSPPSPQSDAYSPVCGYSSSEDETCNSQEEELATDTEVDSDWDTASPAIEKNLDIKDVVEKTLSVSPLSRNGPLETWCLLLLSRMTHMNSVADDMVSNSTVDALLRYYSLIDEPQPRAARLLQRLTRKPLCLLPLIQARFILKINSMLLQHVHDDCERCSQLEDLGLSLLSQLSVLAESAFGEGEIISQLLRGTRSNQALLIISVPHIVRARKPLFRMMNCKIQDLDGLEMLLQLLTDDCGDGLMTEAVESLSRLAQNVGIEISSTKKLCNQNPCQVCVSERRQKFLHPIYFKDNVVLELDDGSLVKTKREMLCRESPVFSAMLTGTFTEAVTKRVHLKDVSKDVLQELLWLIETSGGCLCYLSNSEFAFELLKLADRFIMLQAVEYISQWLLSNLALDSAAVLYKYAQNYRHVTSIDNISQESIIFALVAQAKSKNRIAVFSNILKSTWKQQFVADIISIIRSHVRR